VIKITLVLVLGGLFGLASAEEMPSYLWAQLPLHPATVAALSDKAQTQGIPMAVATETGTLSFIGVDSEDELLAANTYLYLDGPFFLLGVAEGNALAMVRGEQTSAEIICLGTTSPLSRLIPILDELGFLSPGTEVDFVEKRLSLKIPAPPPGVKLDPVLWGLLISPDWFSFARDYGLERIGLRVKVVAEVGGMIPESYESYIQTSSDGLVELFLPIPLLDDLAREKPVKMVRPPYKPQPIVPGRP